MYTGEIHTNNKLILNCEEIILNSENNKYNNNNNTKNSEGRDEWYNVLNNREKMYTVRGSNVAAQIIYLINIYPSELSFYSIQKDEDAVVRYYKTFEQLTDSINDSLDMNEIYTLRQTYDTNIALFTKNHVYYIDNNMFEII